MLTKSALGVYYAHNTRRIACVERVAAVMWARSSENAGEAGKKRATSSCPAKRGMTSVDAIPYYCGRGRVRLRASYTYLMLIITIY